MQRNNLTSLHFGTGAARHSCYNRYSLPRRRAAIGGSEIAAHLLWLRLQRLQQVLGIRNDARRNVRVLQRLGIRCDKPLDRLDHGRKIGPRILPREGVRCIQRARHDHRPLETWIVLLRLVGRRRWLGEVQHLRQRLDRLDIAAVRSAIAAL